MILKLVYFLIISVDVWSVGCIFAELLSRKILFQAQSPVQQVEGWFLVFVILFFPFQILLCGICSV